MAYSIPDASELDYRPIDTRNLPPHFVCNMCGRPLPRAEKGAYTMSVRPDPDYPDTLHYHFCNIHCKEVFRVNPWANNMLRDMWDRVLKLKSIAGSDPSEN